MSAKNNIKKIALVGFLMLAVQVVSAFTGHTDEASKANKYSLKNFSKFSNRGLSISNTKYLLHIKPTELTTLKSNNVSVNNGVQLSNGANTTFIYPYKIKIKVPKFKTPSATN